MESCATTGSTEMGSTVGGTMVVRATVKTEERETFSTEAYTTSKVENCTAGNAYMVDRGSVKAEERAMVNAHALTTVMAKDRSTGNANNMVDCVTVKAEEWAKVSADARATVKAEGRPAVNANMVDRAAAKAQQRATSSPEAHITVKAEDRVAVDADMVDCEAPSEIEECAIFSAEAYVAVKAEDHSAGHTAAHLAPSGALVHELDVTRGDGRNVAQGVIGIHPGQAALASESWNEANTTLEPEDQSAGNSASHSERGAELATMEIPSNDFGRLCDVVRRSICGQTRENRKDKILHPRNDMTCSCANGVGVAAAGQQEGPFARGTKAHDLAEERRTEIVRMNGATRTAVHAIYRHRSHASDETGQMEMNRKTPMESIAPTSGGLISTSAMRELLERRADAHGLAQMSVQERRAERSKVNRATRSPTLTLRRGQRHAAGYWKTVLVDSIAVRTSSDLDVVEAGQEEAQTNRKLSRALGEIGPQQWVRALARINRANRMTALAIKRQQRKAPATEMVEQSAAKCPSQAGAFGGIGSQQLVRDLASIMRAKRMTLRAIKRQQRKTPVKEMAEESAAKGSSQISHQHNRRYAAVAAAKTRWGNADSAAARTEDLAAKGVHAHARTLAETNGKEACELEQQKGQTTFFSGMRAQDQFMRAKLLAEGLWPPVDIAGRPVRLQWGAVAGEGGRLEQDNVQREVNQGNDGATVSSCGPLSSWPWHKYCYTDSESDWSLSSDDGLDCASEDTPRRPSIDEGARPSNAGRGRVQWRRRGGWADNLSAHDFAEQGNPIRELCR